MIFGRLFALAFAALVAPLTAAEPPAPAPDTSLPPGLYAEITTPRGALVCELFFAQAPLTVTNFVGLAEGALGPVPRRPFFNGLKFHRVVPDFVVQGGDPLGTGEGGPGYTFPDEFVPGLRHAAAGTLSMANSGPATNGSQFFITRRETNRLNYLHSVFGRVVRGPEILPLIKPGDAMSVRILRIGLVAENFRADTVSFAALLARTGSAATTSRSPATFFEDPEHLLPTEPLRAQAFNLKLAHFARANGVEIHALLLAHAPPDTDGRKLNLYLHDLAEKLGVLKQGVLLLYLADRAEWKLWIGDDSAAPFMGLKGTVKDFMQDGAFHQAKQDFLAAARAQAVAAAARANPGSNLPLPASQSLKHQVDAILDHLIFKLEPR